MFASSARPRFSRAFTHHLSLSRFPGFIVAASSAVFCGVQAHAQTAVFQPSGAQTQAVDFGSVSVGEKAQQTLTFKFLTNSTGQAIQVPSVLTGGATGLDFQDAGTGTCTIGARNGFPQPADSTCTVDVTFAPKASGTRPGAVVLSTGSGMPIATAYIFGNGVAPQVILIGGNNQAITLVNEPNGNFSMNNFQGTFLRDEAGSFYAELFARGFPPSASLVKYTPSGTTYTRTTLPADGDLQALDAAGDLYYVGSDVVKETPSVNGTYVRSIVASGIKPAYIAVDPRGNVFIADNSGNVAASDMNTIVYEAAYQGGAYTLSTVLTHQPRTNGLAFDATGKILLNPNQRSTAVSPADSPAVAAAKNAHANGVLISDSQGNVYTTQETPAAAQIIQLAFANTAPLLTFTASIGGTPVENLAQVTNIGNAQLLFTGNPTPLPEGFTFNQASNCPGYSATAVPNTLNALTTCQVAINFQPTQLSDGSGTLTLQDNNLNVPNSQQFINLKGTATPGAPILAVTPSTLPAATSGVAYSTILTASGGVAPYTFQPPARLPTGLDLSSAGVLSGTPTGYGTYVFPIFITDSRGVQGSNNVTLTIAAPPNTNPVDAGKGFSSSLGLHLNGSAAITGTNLTLTDGKVFESSTAWSAAPVSIAKFTTDFQFRITNAQADGFTFALQNTNPNALGYLGGDLGYGGIPSSVAAKFDLFNNVGEQANSVGFYSRGNMPTFPSSVLQNGLDLKSGDIFQAHLTYDGISLTLTVTDTVTSKSSTFSEVLDLPTLVGSPTAYAGFTAGTGALTSTINILNWTYTVTP